MDRRNALSFLIAGAAVLLGARVAGARTIRTLGIAFPSGSADWIESTPLVRSMNAQLAASGFGPDGALRRLYRSAEGRTSAQDAFARAVLAERPDVLFVASRTLTTHFKAAGAELPIVCYVADPVGTGLVASLARPGGNITGVTSDTGPRLYAKRLQLLRDMGLPVRRPAFLTPNSQDASPFIDALRAQADGLVTLRIASPLGRAAIDAALASAAAAGVDAILASDSVSLLPHAGAIVEATARHRLPAIYGHPVYVEKGGLAAYAIDEADVGQLAGQQLARILAGQKPGDMPFLQPARFALSVSLSAARAIGIEVPAQMQLMADTLID